MDRPRPALAASQRVRRGTGCAFQVAAVEPAEAVAPCVRRRDEDRLVAGASDRPAAAVGLDTDPRPAVEVAEPRGIDGIVTAVDRTGPRKGSVEQLAGPRGSSPRVRRSRYGRPRDRRDDRGELAGDGARWTRRQPEPGRRVLRSWSDSVQAAAAGSGPSPIRTGDDDGACLAKAEDRLRRVGRRDPAPQPRPRAAPPAMPRPAGRRAAARAVLRSEASDCAARDDRTARPACADRLQGVDDRLAGRAVGVRAGPRTGAAGRPRHARSATSRRRARRRRPRRSRARSGRTATAGGSRSARSQVKARAVAA